MDAIALMTDTDNLRVETTSYYLRVEAVTGRAGANDGR